MSDTKVDGAHKSCATCIHFGQLKGVRGKVINTVCLAPVTTEPPPSGVVPAKHRFVYLTSASSECELYTPYPTV